MSALKIVQSIVGLVFVSGCIATSFVACSSPDEETQIKLQVDAYTFLLDRASDEYKLNRNIDAYCKSFTEINRAYPLQSSKVQQYDSKNFQGIEKTCKDRGWTI